jgi:hypothetical protein
VLALLLLVWPIWEWWWYQRYGHVMPRSVLALLLVVRLIWEWLVVAPTCDAPSGFFIFVDGTAALVMVLERTEKRDDTQLGVGIVVGGMEASACDAPLGVGIVVGGTAALGIVVARTA